MNCSIKKSIREGKEKQNLKRICSKNKILLHKKLHIHIYKTSQI
jgi:hypothetical protein